VTDQVLIKEYDSLYARLPINQSTACDQASFDFVLKKEGSLIEKQCLKSSAMPNACELSQSFIKTLFQPDSSVGANLTPIRIEFQYTCGFYSKFIRILYFLIKNGGNCRITYKLPCYTAVCIIIVYL
jgi:hypothetical protein